MIFRFRKFPVYILLRDLRKELKALSRKKFPDEEKYSLRAQLWRAIDSALLNIAEGSNRYSDKDFSRFLNNSVTSLNEVAAILDCALDDEYIDEEDHRTYILKVEDATLQLMNFSASVRRADRQKGKTL